MIDLDTSVFLWVLFSTAAGGAFGTGALSVAMWSWFVRRERDLAQKFQDNIRKLHDSHVDDYQRLTDELRHKGIAIVSRPSTISFNADGDINIGGNVVGRDEIKR